MQGSTLTTSKEALTSDFQEQLIRTQHLQTIGGLAVGIAHDLNNALTPILLLASNSSNTGLGVESTQTVVSLATRAKDLLTHLLMVARGLNDQKKYEKVSTLLEEAHRLLRTCLPRSIQFSVQNVKEEIFIFCHRTQIHQALANLVLNAKDAIRGTGQISISAKIEFDVPADESQRSRSPYLQVVVEDSGEGFSQCDLSQIFEPFYTTKKESQGLGLGLTSTLAIVRSHGGFMSASPGDPKGALFKIFLPILLPNQNRSLILVDAVILLVSQDSLERNLLKTLFENEGASIFSCATAEEALTIFSQLELNINVAIIDEGLPEFGSSLLTDYFQKLEPPVSVTLLKLPCSQTNQELVGMKRPLDTRSLIEEVRQNLQKKPRSSS